MTCECANILLLMGETMINFVVVEDNEQYRKIVVEIIVKFMMSNSLDFKVHEFDDYDKKLIKHIRNNKENNIYILDFDLPSGTAIDVARDIRLNDWLSQIIVLTAYNSFALSSFKKRLVLLDYLLKDSNYVKDLHELFDLCIEIFGLNKSFKFTYKSMDHVISLKSILYVVREGRRTAIVTDKKIYYQNKSVNEIKVKLGKSFLKSTKGAIINMDRVKCLNWKTFNVTFDNDLCKNLLSIAHKKELENYGRD